MGGCAGKSSANVSEGKGDGSEVKSRRSHILSKADGAGALKGNLADGGMVDYMPGAAKRFCVCGQPTPPETSQKAFSDKRMQRAGDGEYKIGFACKKGLKPESPNQDDFCIYRAEKLGCPHALYGVFDGHGPFGHDISNFVRHTLVHELVRDPRFETEPATTLEEAFPKTQKLCVDKAGDGSFDAALSGTTGSLVVQKANLLVVGHVGDCRVVVARKDDAAGKFRANDLTKDHKPNEEGEKQRIQRRGGQVKRLEGDIPYRVFLQGKMYPGLAVSRSLGDTTGAEAGIVCHPEVSKFNIGPDWRFMLICSDGIWEFITSDEAVEMVGRYPPSDAQKAAEQLASEAWNRWIKEEVNVADDITVILVWFNHGD